MKKLILILAFIVFGCAAAQESPHVIVTDTTPPPLEIPYIPPVDDLETGPVVLALYTGATLKFYDGNVIWTWREGNIAGAGPRSYAYENVLYNLDEYGDTDTSKNLVAVPDYIGVSGASAWIAQNVPPAEAYDAGAMYKDYVRIYQDSAEYGDWTARQYQISDLVMHGNDVYAMSGVGAWYHINGTRTGVKIAIRDGFACWNFNATAKTAVIDGVAVSWSLNFFNGAKYWLRSGDVWYSQNGYSWDGATLIEGGLAMSVWRGQPYPTGYIEGPVVISAGTRYENGEDVLYWIECNTGWIIRHIPSTDQITLLARIYTGDGLRETGLLYQNALRPVVIAENLYFVFDAQVYRYNLNSGLCSFFANGVLEVLKY